MYLEALQQQLAVCSFEGAARLTGLDRHYWNVVSIHGPREQKAELRLAKAVCYACFDDVQEADSVLYHSARAADIADIFTFIRSLGSEPPLAPLMIHCQQGLSRSAAVMLAWIYGQLPATGDRFLQAINLLLQLRPEAKPNRLVLTLGLAHFMDLSAARSLAEQMVCEPRLAKNRFQDSLSP